MERQLLMIGSSCVDVVIPVERLPKTGDDLQPEKQTFTISNGKETKVYPFTIGAFDLELVKAGGWVGYADKKY